MPFHHMTRWGDALRGNDSPDTDSSAILNVDARLDNKVTWHQPVYALPEEVQAYRSDQEASRPVDKIQRRLAQNREAARKSRLRKKAYVQQLETSRLKLAQMEQELERARRQMQGMYIAGASDASYSGFSGTNNSAIAAFEMEYGHWVEEQNRQICELRNALQVHITDIELRILVESGLNHYYNLFRIKGDIAKADVFYLTSGIWRTPTERFFHWLGGFRPSEILNVIMPQIEPLTDQQMLEVSNLRQSSQQAEDALSQGIDQLQQTLAQCMAAAGISPGDYTSQLAACAEKLDALESFVSQADHLRQQTLQHMHRILTTRQAARGLLALGEYFHRLRALSSLWAARPHEPT